MITEVTGNLLKSKDDALVNTVNCVGFMGKGIALQFKKAFPANFIAYQKACKAGEVQPGKMFIWRSEDLLNTKYVINFPTKRHWKGKSRLEDVKAGLTALVAEVQTLGIRSIAIPPLGCGLGGLSWREVKPLIEQAFAALPEVDVHVYAPKGEPDVHHQVNRTPKPALTHARALFIRLMAQYAGLDYRLSLLEIQKLAYFLQESGEPLRLKFDEHFYGPYADNLNKVLEILEGHYSQGYSGDRKPDTPLTLLNGASVEADQFLKAEADDESLKRLDRVSKLIDGFETPYGMELLASVYWVATHPSDSTDSDITIEQIIDRIHRWTRRKAIVMKPLHIRTAYNRLVEQGWLLHS
ncbi:MAG: macro domain-containing protein [Deltaproteobacteria bacterium]|nr:macro domain-containing protein [Deltaproteobacteria bacterium]